VRALKTGLLVGVILAQLVTWANRGWTQTTHPLQSRIPKPDPKLPRHTGWEGLEESYVGRST
jgi:hypothetical protein